MKYRKITAVLLGLSLFLTGCGGTAEQKDSKTDSTDITSSQEVATEPLTELTAAPKAPETEPVTVTEAATAAPTTEEPQTAAQTVNNTENSNNSGADEQPQENNSESGNEDYQPTVTTAAYVHTSKRTTACTTTTKHITTTTTAKATPKDVLKNMTLKQKVCQMFMVTPEAITGISPMTEVGNGTKNAMNDYPVGGIIYFSQNLSSRNQIKTMISNTQGFSREACGVGLFIGVDER